MDEKYQKYYSEDSLKSKLGKVARLAGVKVIYAVLLLYFMMKDSQIPIKTKLIITAALGYFILPTDAIPDIAPLIGFSDDLGVLIFALSQVSANITPEIKSKAKKKLSSWFGDFEKNDISEIENIIL